jgi:hypothetical protein
MTAPGHETRDLPPRGILLALLGIFVLIGLSAAIVAGLLRFLDSQAQPPSLTTFPSVAETPAGPPLEVDPAAERRALEARARARLESYGWVDRDAGIAHIPVQRAMDLLADHGWPSEPPP